MSHSGDGGNVAEGNATWTYLTALAVNAAWGVTHDGRFTPMSSLISVENWVYLEDGTLDNTRTARQFNARDHQHTLTSPLNK